MKINILFEPRDLWVGVYWDDKEFHSAPADKMTTISVSPYVMYPRRLYVYICIIPMLPLRLIFPLRKWRPGPFDEMAKYIVEQ